MAVATIPERVTDRHAHLIRSINADVRASPELRLIAAVIATALTDARAGDEEAVAWLAGPAALFWLYRLVPGELEPESVQQTLLAAAGRPDGARVATLSYLEQKAQELGVHGNQTRYIQSCGVCGVRFEARRRDARFCSSTCRSRSSRPKRARQAK